MKLMDYLSKLFVKVRHRHRRRSVHYLCCRHLVLAWVEGQDEEGIDATHFWYIGHADGEGHTVGCRDGQFFDIWLAGRELRETKVELTTQEVESGNHYGEYALSTARRVLNKIRNEGTV